MGLNMSLTLKLEPEVLKKLKKAGYVKSNAKTDSTLYMYLYDINNLKFDKTLNEIFYRKFFIKLKKLIKRCFFLNTKKITGHSYLYLKRKYKAPTVYAIQKNYAMKTYYGKMHVTNAYCSWNR